MMIKPMLLGSNVVATVTLFYKQDKGTALNTKIMVSVYSSIFSSLLTCGVADIAKITFMVACF